MDSLVKGELGALVIVRGRYPNSYFLSGAAYIRLPSIVEQLVIIIISDPSQREGVWEWWPTLINVLSVQLSSW